MDEGGWEELSGGLVAGGGVRVRGEWLFSCVDSLRCRANLRQM